VEEHFIAFFAHHAHLYSMQYDVIFVCVKGIALVEMHCQLVERSGVCVLSWTQGWIW
jgi:hypothetical protein